jgi:methyltransferase family protein
MSQTSPVNNGPLHILAPFVPTPQDAVDRMLKLAEVKSEDMIYDLGCSDGRIVTTAAKDYGSRGVGFDIEPCWVEESQANAKKAGVEHLVTFKQQDALTVDMSPATVLTLYLVEWSTAKLQPIITSSVKARTGIISHNFCVNNRPPAKVEEFVDAVGNPRTLYLWIVNNKESRASATRYNCEIGDR